jgi:hypothetical protein
MFEQNGLITERIKAKIIKDFNVFIDKIRGNMNGNIIKRSYKIGKSYNFKMQMGWSVLSWAATI